MSQQGARKQLEATGAALAFQKGFGKTLKERVIERGEPFVVAQADTPHEIFHAMDIPLVSNQWWSAYISAKQMAGPYFDRMVELGYPRNSCRYCSLGLACSLANDPATAPWGGLPKPTMLLARLSCDCIQHVFSEWARVLDTELFCFEAPAWTHKEIDWFDRSNEHWDEVYQADRIALMAAETRRLITRVEEITGRNFDEGRFRHLMGRINEQEGYIAEAARLIGSTRPCPVSIVDQMPNVMIPQWHRGSDWAVSHAKRVRDEVRARVDAGIGACQNERVRLMWIGAGLWHDSSFYQSLEEAFGAVFVWSMYMPFAGPQYIRAIKDRPMEALASRLCSANEVLHLPPWMNGWMISEAKRCAIDAAILLVPPENRLSQSGTKITAAALRELGIPLMEVSADMVDPANWDHDRMVGMFRTFLAQERLI